MHSSTFARTYLQSVTHGSAIRNGLSACNNPYICSALPIAMLTDRVRKLRSALTLAASADEVAADRLCSSDTCAWIAVASADSSIESVVNVAPLSHFSCVICSASSRRDMIFTALPRIACLAPTAGPVGNDIDRDFANSAVTEAPLESSGNVMTYGLLKAFHRLSNTGTTVECNLTIRQLIKRQFCTPTSQFTNNFSK